MDFQHLTTSELLTSRSLAKRAIRRNRNVEQSQEIVQKIETELNRRRNIRFGNAYEKVPTLYPGLDNDEV